MLQVVIKVYALNFIFVALPGSVNMLAARINPEMSSYGCYSTDSTSSPWAKAHATSKAYPLIGWNIRW
jgi:hypothetical protein